MKRRLPLLIWAFVPVHISNAIAQTGDGYIGIYADSAGTIPCTSVPQPGGTTLYVIGKLAGATAQGITGAEFRVEVTDPDGWVISYSPPDAAIIIGNPIDTDPEDPGNGAGINLSFENCLEPGILGNVALGKITVLNWAGTSTQLLVKRHSSPTNHNYLCPLFTSCETPTFPTSCMTPSAGEPCSLSTANKTWSSATSETDPIVFGAALLSTEGAVQIEPLPPRDERLVLVYTPSVQDIAVTPLLSKPQKILQDTVWLKTWTFDAGSAPCTNDGWQAVDLRHTNNGNLYWSVSSEFDGRGDISNKALVLKKSDTCWPAPGYGNYWDQAIRITYQDTTILCFDYLLDSDPGGDFLSVEEDPDCDSFDLAQDYTVPSFGAASYRKLLFRTSGNDSGQVCVALDSLGNPSIPDCVYIRFVSGGRISPEDSYTNIDGDPWTLGAGLVVDNIEAYVNSALFIDEDFEGQRDANVTEVNSGDALFGNWARTYPEASDNDVCTWNTSCAWLWTDHTTPTLANDPSTSYGPGEFVIKNWLDNAIISPWISVPNPATNLVLTWREFSGNPFIYSSVVLGLAARGKIGCVTTPWSREGVTRSDRDGMSNARWFTLDRSYWESYRGPLAPIVDPILDSLQLRFRVTDWQWVADPTAAPVPHMPGPGPYLDRVRVGQLQYNGPLVFHGPGDSRWQAQDAFPAADDGGMYVPSRERFETCPFSSGEDLALPGNNPLRPGDTIKFSYIDAGNVGGIKFVGIWYSIVAGPHAGKTPPLKDDEGQGAISLGNGCYADAANYSANPRSAGGLQESFDDAYFRGGDVLRYFWWAKDALDRVTSSPPGITFDPVSPTPLSSVALAESLTGGLWEVNFLPTIEWDSSYVARAQTDPTGGAPTPSEIANSHQRNCILYVNRVNTERRSTDLNRTSFMYTLDRLGYRDSAGTRQYDVYDLQGFGSTNNDLGGRADVEAAGSYALIVHDTGHSGPEMIPLPDGSNPIDRKIDQATWYREWLELSRSAPQPLAGTLWLIGEDIVEALTGNELLGPNYAQVTLAHADQRQGGNVNPYVRGLGGSSFLFQTGDSSYTNVYFNTADDAYALHGGCPSVRDYDGLGTGGMAASKTHWYCNTDDCGSIGDGAVVMAHSVPTSAGNWNTIMMSHAWFDIAPIEDPATPGLTFAGKILSAVVPVGCSVPDTTITDVSSPELETDLPQVTQLLGNHPNPFNPSTLIRFAVAAEGRIVVGVYDVAGRHVRTLVQEPLKPGYRDVTWDGLDATGRSVASGIYFVRLVAAGVRDVRKVVLLR